MRFSRGELVRARLMNPEGHSRLPAYLRGRRGRIDRVVGAYPFPGERAAGAVNAREETLYTVRFDAVDVWGADAAAAMQICADLFESYLEPAP